MGNTPFTKNLGAKFFTIKIPIIHMLHNFSTINYEINKLKIVCLGSLILVATKCVLLIVFELWQETREYLKNLVIILKFNNKHLKYLKKNVIHMLQFLFSKTKLSNAYNKFNSKLYCNNGCCLSSNNQKYVLYMVK